MDFRGHPHQRESHKHRADYKGADFGDYNQEGLAERDFYRTARTDECEERRADDSECQIAEQRYGDKDGYGASEHGRDNRGSGGCRAKDTYHGALGEVIAEWRKGEIGRDAADYLHPYNTPCQGRQPELGWLDTAERDEQHREDEVRCEKLHCADKIVKKHAAHHCDGQHPRLEPLTES